MMCLPARQKRHIHAQFPKVMQAYFETVQRNRHCHVIQTERVAKQACIYNTVMIQKELRHPDKSICNRRLGQTLASDNQWRMPQFQRSFQTRQSKPPAAPSPQAPSLLSADGGVMVYYVCTPFLCNLLFVCVTPAALRF